MAARHPGTFGMVEAVAPGVNTGMNPRATARETKHPTTSEETTPRRYFNPRLPGLIATKPVLHNGHSSGFHVSIAMDTHDTTSTPG